MGHAFCVLITLCCHPTKAIHSKRPWGVSKYILKSEEQLSAKGCRVIDFNSFCASEEKHNLGRRSTIERILTSTQQSKIQTMWLQRAVAMTRRSAALTRYMKLTPRKYVHLTAINDAMTPSLAVNNNSALNNYGAARDDNKMMSITSRTMSSKPCFSWEEKRVDVTTPEEFQRRLNRIKVGFWYTRASGHSLNSPYLCCKSMCFLIVIIPMSQFSCVFAFITRQRLSEEAQSCIQDVRESLETDHFEEELQCAEMAVGNAGIAYSELLEELALTNEGVQLLNEVRKVVAPAIESLREELRHIGKLKSKEG